MYETEEFDPDPLNVSLKWLNGSCYRIYNTKSPQKEEQRLKPYCEFDDEEQFQDYENCSNVNDSFKFEIKQTENGRFESLIAVPQCFYAYIIGTKGSRKKQIETSTKTEIKIPRQKNDKNIIINGPTASNVVSARQKIELITTDLRERHPITHFVSFPLIADEIKSNFNKFKQQIVNEGIDESIFISGDKLHLTIGTLTLLDEDEVSAAAKVFENLKNEVIDIFFLASGPIRFHIKGLQYMNDDPSAVDVLYAIVNVVDHTNHQLQQLSNAIVDYFYKHKLMKKDYDKVKLHVTLMNTRYQRDKSNDRMRRSFDARPILDKYGDFDFGYQDFKEIHLSDRGSVDKNGYYGCVASIKID